MSSPRAAGKPAKQAARKPAVAPAATPADAGALDADAGRLAAEIERALADGHTDSLSPAAVQDLMAALCKTYSAQVEAGSETLPLRSRTIVTGTDVMTTASGLLKAANLAVFELGMWQSWTGR
jgi:uncharacterized heparinase superfamily protein